MRARSRENPSHSNTDLALWTVLPFASSAFNLSPKRRRCWMRANYNVLLRNQGNAPVTFTLNALDDEEQLNYQFGEDTLTIEPGSSKRTNLIVRPNHWLWWGKAQQHRFSVQARPQSEGNQHSDSGQVTQQVFFARWMFMLIVVSIIPMLASLWFWYRPQIIDLRTTTTVPVAGDEVMIRWAVTNGPTVQLLINETPVPRITDPSYHIIGEGFTTPPEIKLIARNWMLGSASRSLSVSLIAPTRTPTITPSIERTATPLPTETPIPPPLVEISIPPTEAPPTNTPTITPTPTSQALCIAGSSLSISGQAPPGTPLLLYFDERPVGGGFSDANGNYSIQLGRVLETPGNYVVSVRIRDNGQILRSLTCIVPSPTPVDSPTPDFDLLDEFPTNEAE
ncbi:hypothetical protein [Candidatus Viridilinea mediisalina]|uniref:hypothetical protein n=1 Tax=Candidatus Viridilinea mediisalina TaxID=2024553 RepID=UPI0013FE382C|nr:hypothetical protein [Candidatus Viridilinea mediisalina]